MITSRDDYFHQVSYDTIKNVDFLQMAKFWTCLIFYDQDFSLLSDTKQLDYKVWGYVTLTNFA